MWHVEVFIHQSQPHGKYLFQSGWKVLDPCIKFIFKFQFSPTQHHMMEQLGISSAMSTFLRLR
jgi:hypothetical protein